MKLLGIFTLSEGGKVKNIEAVELNTEAAGDIRIDGSYLIFEVITEEEYRRRYIIEAPILGWLGFGRDQCRSEYLAEAES